jgi:four helix bundle protein
VEKSCEIYNRAKMGTIKRFEDLEIWQLARELSKLIYDDFRSCKDFTFKNQIISAALSIMNNIAEGFSRDSDKEFKQFLNISKGSDGEVKSMYYVAEDQKYVSIETATERRNRTEVLMLKITNFMFYLKK